MRRLGSALVLAIVVTGFLLVTALGALSLAYNQLSSLDRVQNSASAGSAAVAGVARLKAKLASGDSTLPEAYNLSGARSMTTPTNMANFRPSPKDLTYAIDSVNSVLDLPRCVAVAVLSSWTNDARYLFSGGYQQNPALIFYYANIVSDTPLGVVAANTATSSDNSLASGLKSQPVSALTKVGHFYNPYAVAGIPTSDPAYWTLKMGGLEDQFLTKKVAGSNDSYYRDLDFVYLPYLPRFADTALKDSATSTVSRQSAANIQTALQDVIVNNNFKIWLDGSVTNQDLFRYGLGDLFTSSSKYKLTWLQPSLTTDLPETGPYINTSFYNQAVNDQAMTWSKPTKPLKTDFSSPGGWTTEIWRSSRSSGLAVPDGDLTRTITSGSSYTFPFYGSYQGIRVGRFTDVIGIDSQTKTPIMLDQRGATEQGRFKNATISNIDTAANTITINFSAANSGFDTPNKLDGTAAKLSDISALVIDPGLQPSIPAFSGAGVSASLSADGQTVTLSAAVACATNTAAKCPAVGDLINLKQPTDNQRPVWGIVQSVIYSGSQVTGFKLDSFREYPKPLYNMQSRAGASNIIYFGGQVSANEYDGGINSISNETWIYTPGTNTWTYVSTAGGNTPGQRAGGRIYQVGPYATEFLVLFGGYRYEAIGNINGVSNPCTDLVRLERCLQINQPYTRIAKVFPTDYWRFNPATNTWTQISPPAATAPPAASPNPSYRSLKVLSHWADRSGTGKPRITSVIMGGSSFNSATLTVTPGTIKCYIGQAGDTTGFAFGDTLKLSGNLAGGGTWEGWGRFLAKDVSCSGYRIQIYGSSGSSSVTFVQNGLKMEVVETSYADTKCLWASTQSCTVSTADLTGMSIGDAVVLEKYNPEGYGTSTSINGQYYGFISSITSAGGSNWNVYFAASETVAGLNDFDSAITSSNLTNIPYGRENPGCSGGNGTIDLRICGGTQLTGKAIAPAGSAIIVASTSAPPAYGITGYGYGGSATNLSASPETYILYSAELPASATIFTSNSTNGVNSAMVRDLATSRTRPGQASETVNTWDNSKTWLLEIEGEGNTSWSGDKLALGAEVLVEKNNHTTISGVGGTSAHESFRGTITAIQFPGTTENPGSNYRISVQHSGQNDTGLTTDAANARVTLFYPNLSGATNGLRITGLTRVTVSQVQSTNITEILKLPVGSYVTLIPASLDTETAGGVLTVFNGKINSRSGTVVSGALSTVQLDSSGPRYQNQPFFGSYGSYTASEVDSSSIPVNNTPVGYLGSQRYRGMTWANTWNAAGNWTAQFSNASASRKFPPPSLATNANRVTTTATDRTYFTVAGTLGSSSTIWKDKNINHVDQSNATGRDLWGGDWLSTVSSPKATDNLPLLDRPSFNLVGSGSTYTSVVFGGRSPAVASSPLTGTRVGSQAYNDSGTDGSFSLASTNKTSSDSGYEASQFFDLSYSQGSGLSSARESLKLSNDAGGNMNTPSDGDSVCRYLGEVSGAGYGCQYASSRLLGTLGRWGVPMGESLAIINPGSSYLYDGSASTSNRALIMSGPGLSGQYTNNRWEQSGYNAYACDTGGGCTAVTSGSLTAAGEAAGDNTSTTMMAGWAKYTDGTSQTCQNSGLNCPEILVTPTGIGQAIVTGPAGPSYCADYTVSSGTYSCNTTAPDSRVLSFIPDAEDLLFLFNSAKVLAAEGKYKVTGYYGGVKRGYLVAPRAASGDYVIREIVP